MCPVESPFQVAWDSEERTLLQQLTLSRTAPLRRVQRARATWPVRTVPRTRLLPARLACICTPCGAGVKGSPRGPGRAGGPTLAGPLAPLRPRRAPGHHRHRHLRPARHRQPVDPSAHSPSPGLYRHLSVQAGRILADLDLKPHLVRGWLTGPEDPDFSAKAGEVCALYLHRPRWCSAWTRRPRCRLAPGAIRPGPAPAESSAASSSTAGTAPPPLSRPWTCTPGRSWWRASPETTRRPSSASCACWITASARP